MAAARVTRDACDEAVDAMVQAACDCLTVEGGQAYHRINGRANLAHLRVVLARGLGDWLRSEDIEVS